VLSLSNFLFCPAIWLVPAMLGILNIGLLAVAVVVPVSVLIWIPAGLVMLVEIAGLVGNVLLLGTICAFNTFCNKLAGMLANDPICTVVVFMFDSGLVD